MASKVKRVVGAPMEVQFQTTTTVRTNDVIQYVGNTFHLWKETSTAGKLVSAFIGGVEVEYAKDTNKDSVAGELVFFDTSESKVTTVSTGNERIGRASVAATTGAALQRFNFIWGI